MQRRVGSDAYLSVWIVTLMIILGAAAGSPGLAQEKPKTPKIEEDPIRPMASVDGKDTFMSHCAVCHGADGKGNGPAAPALKVPVPDLTTYASRHGKFDALAVERTIAGSDKMPVAHGTRTMPIWGPIFRSVDDPARMKLRLRNLVQHVQSIQQQ